MVAAADIAALDGMEGLFVGPADLAFCLDKTDMTDPAVRDAVKQTASAAQQCGKPV